MSRYAGMFEVWLEGMPGKALCVDTDEMQSLCNRIADAGFKGIPVEATHVMGLYDAPARLERLEKQEQWLKNALRFLRDKKEEAKSE